MAAAVLSGCGGGGGSSPPVVATAPAVPTGLSLGYDVKAFKLSWAAVAPPAGGGTVTYGVTEDPDGAGPQAATQIATDLTAASYSQQVNGLLHTRLNATYTVQACNSAGCSALAKPVTVDLKQAMGYFKASNTGAQDNFGQSVALSADGNTLAVGATWEASNATGINGDQENYAISGAGAVYVFARSAEVWSQQAYIKASDPQWKAFLGVVIALSADGSTLAAGTSGVGVHVFTRDGSTWSALTYVRASKPWGDSNFGGSVALSAGANTLVVGDSSDGSNAAGINGNQADNTSNFAGAVYLY